MTNVLVRNVPDDVHAVLQRKAEEQHQSLQQYLTSELRRLAERRSLADALADVETRHGGRIGLRQAVEDLGAERTRR